MVEHFVYTEGAAGPNPAPSTMNEKRVSRITSDLSELSTDDLPALYNIRKKLDVRLKTQPWFDDIIKEARLKKSQRIKEGANKILLFKRLIDELWLRIAELPENVDIPEFVVDDYNTFPDGHNPIERKVARIASKLDVAQAVSDALSKDPLLSDDTLESSYIVQQVAIKNLRTKLVEILKLKYKLQQEHAS